MTDVVAPLLQLYEYDGVPPDTETLMIPFEPPKQETDWLTVADALNWDDGSLMFCETELVQPLASVIVTVYVPAIKDEISCEVDPLLQE